MELGVWEGEQEEGPSETLGMITPASRLPAAEQKPSPFISVSEDCGGDCPREGF